VPPKGRSEVTDWPSGIDRLVSQFARPRCSGPATFPNGPETSGERASSLEVREWLGRRVADAERRRSDREAQAAQRAYDAALKAAGLRSHGGETLRRLSAAGRVPVVGEESYQPALQLAARGAVVAERDLASAIPVCALLVPEPDSDEHDDPNAVRVDVSLPEGRVTVGYLSTGVAPHYQPALLELTDRGEVGWCPGMIMGGGDRIYGIHLWLAENPPFVVSNDFPPGGHLIAGGWTVRLAKGETDKGVLEPYRPHGESRTRVYVVLSPAQVASQMKPSAPVIEAHIDGRCAGQFTPKMSERYWATVNGINAQGELPVCEGVVSHADAGLKFELRLRQMT
jgi:hypothetical protein